MFIEIQVTARQEARWDKEQQRVEVEVEIDETRIEAWSKSFAPIVEQLVIDAKTKYDKNQIEIARQENASGS